MAALGLSEGTQPLMVPSRVAKMKTACPPLMCESLVRNLWRILEIIEIREVDCCRPTEA